MKKAFGIIFINLILILTIVSAEEERDLEAIKKLISIIESELEKNTGKSDLNEINNSIGEDEYIKNWLNDKNKEGILWNWIQYYDDKQLEFIAEKLKKSLKWRFDNKLDAIKNWLPPPYFGLAFPYRVIGIDNLGNLVYYVDPADWDIRGHILNGHRTDMFKYLLQIGESVVNMDRAYLMKKLNTTELPERALNTIHLIVNMDNFSVLQVSSIRVLTLFAAVLRAYEANYPLLVKKTFVVNSPNFAVVLLNVMKSTLSARTLDMIQLFGKNPDSWSEALKKTFPFEIIPKELGGEA